MAHFEARYVTDTDQAAPSLRLTVRESQYSERSVGALLTKSVAVADFNENRIPVFYSFEDSQPAVAGNDRLDPPVPARAEIPAKLTIVAGPGVAVEVTGIDPLRRPSVNEPLIDIFRVQDPNIVPTIGARFSPGYLTSGYFVNSNPPAMVGPTLGGDEDGGSPVFDSRYDTEERITRYNDPLVQMVNWYPINRFDVLGSARDVMVDLFTGLMLDLGLDPEDAAEPLRAGATPSMTTVWLPPRTHVDVQRTQEGVRFLHGFSAQALEVKVRRNHLTTSSADLRTDHLQRFAYDISHDETTGLVRVTVVKTPQVEVNLSIDLELVSTDEPRGRLYARVASPVFVVKDTALANIPPQGAPLPTTGLHDADIPVTLPPWVGIMQAALDVMVGFIPVLGDAIDIAEFANAMMNGTDRWGRQLSGWEKAFLGVGAVLTLVGPSISVLRRAPGLFGRNRRAAERVHAAIAAARYTDDERRFMAESYEALANGRRLAEDAAARLQGLLRRIPRCTA